MSDEPSLPDLFAACTHSASHLEMRDGYMLTDPMWLAWQQGHKEDPSDPSPSWRPWLGLVRSAVQRGVAVRRVRIVSEPFSDYVRFEHEITPINIAAGEQVRWLPRHTATDLALPGNDFWLFDDHVLLVNHFSGNGDKVRSELVENPDAIKLCSAAFDAVWHRGADHSEYQPA